MGAHWVFSELQEGVLERRYKRFLADVVLPSWVSLSTVTSVESEFELSEELSVSPPASMSGIRVSASQPDLQIGKVIIKMETSS